MPHRSRGLLEPLRNIANGNDHATDDRDDEWLLSDTVRQHRLLTLAGIRRLRDQERTQALAANEGTRVFRAQPGSAATHGPHLDRAFALSGRGRGRRRAVR